MVYQQNRDYHHIVSNSIISNITMLIPCVVLYLDEKERLP